MMNVKTVAASLRKTKCCADYECKLKSCSRHGHLARHKPKQSLCRLWVFTSKQTAQLGCKPAQPLTARGGGSSNRAICRCFWVLISLRGPAQDASTTLGASICAGAVLADDLLEGLPASAVVAILKLRLCRNTLVSGWALDHLVFAINSPRIVARGHHCTAKGGKECSSDIVSAVCSTGKHCGHDSEVHCFELKCKPVARVDCGSRQNNRCDDPTSCKAVHGKQ